MIDGIEVNCHSSIKIKKEKIIYVDPFKIEKSCNDADIIFITHSHYDHFSEEDILKVKNNNTVIVITEDLISKVYYLGFTSENTIVVNPNMDFNIENINVKTIPAYNIKKQFHPKINEWVGYIINIQGVRYYIAGDTDMTEENRCVKCDIAFVPVGGTYTMDLIDAASLINTIKPKIVVPIHYGEIVGIKSCGEKFKQRISKDIECEILL